MKTNRIKRTLLLICAILVSFSFSLHAEADYKGRLTPTITWALEDNTLYIKGKGSMKTQANSGPWLKYIVSRVGDGPPPFDLRRIVVGEGITEVCYFDFMASYFEYNPKILEVQLPSTLRSIGENAFAGTDLRYIRIPDGVTKIGKQAFKDCKWLTTVILPKGLKEIDTDAFCSCYQLKYCYIPEGLTKLAYHSFYGCENLIFNFPPSVKVEKGAFDYTVNKKIPFAKRIIRMPKGYEHNDTEPLKYATLDEWLNAVEPMLADYTKPLMQAKAFPADSVRTLVQAKVAKWEEKDEFETTDEWNARVTEATRKAFVDKTLAEISAQANKQNDVYNKEVAEVQGYYDKIYAIARDRFYDIRAYVANQELRKSALELKPYDADHGSFMISGSNLGDILLPVPRAEAPGFKERWPEIAKTVRGKYVPWDNTISLKEIVFTDGTNKYTYDSHTEAVYAHSEVAHKFSPVEIGEISVESLNLPFTRKEAKPNDNLVATKAAPSDVDLDIPEGRLAHPNTFAIVIANEHYKHAEEVPFAENDGKVMAEYLKKTLKVPEKQILHMTDATLNDMNFALSQIRQYDSAFGDNLDIIVYYAGHGLPDEYSRDSYLLPVDGYGSTLSTALKLSDLYDALSSVRARSVNVFIDACFSGAIRSGQMLRSSRGVAIKPKTNTPKGNMVVFSAAQGDETAAAYKAKQHGLFTYFLLKKIKEKAGDVSLGELGDYITDNVMKSSVIENGKIQTPSISTSKELTDSWQGKKL